MLQELVPEIRKTAGLVVEISTACREQNVGADQINQAIQQLNQVTQQNAAASDEMSATAEELAGQAQQLRQQTAYFRLGSEIEATDRRQTDGSRPASGERRPAATRPEPRHAKGAARATRAAGFALDLPRHHGLDDSHFERMST
jgi:methyl-accepting chemotaxis protein